MDLRLPSLKIENYRTFKSLDIKKVGRVNLLVGKNNVGKTSVLEAVRLWAEQGSLSCLLDILGARDETGFANSIAKLSGKNDYPLLGATCLFRDYPYLGSEISPIAIGSPCKYLLLGFYQIVSSLTETGSLGSISDGEFELSIHFSPEPSLHEAYSHYHSPLEEIRSLPLLADKTEIKRKIAVDQNRSNRFNDKITPMVFVPASAAQKQFSLWDAIAATGKERIVIDGLRLIEPDIDEIRLIERKNSTSQTKERLPVAWMGKHSRRIPLQSLGDGTVRLFELMLALVNAENGILLLDEMENGLHHSVQKKVWKTFFQMAKKLDVQIIATTHSWDCVKTFQEAAAENEPGDGVLIKLYRPKESEDVRASCLYGEDLNCVIEADMEVR